MTAERIPASAKRPPYEDVEDDLTIEYPSSDGEPMAENEWQLTAMVDAINSLREWFDSREDVYVGGDMLMYYRINDNETRVAPDVFVVIGVENREKRHSWIVWREGRPPDFVMEMASGSTWRRDMREKRAIYAEMGVTEYWRFDPSGNYYATPLIGETLADGEYREIPAHTDADGLLRGHSAVLGLDFCVMPDGDLRFNVPGTGQWLRTHRESEAALRAETAAREEAQAARQAVEAALLEETAARQAAEDEIQRLRELLRQSGSGQ